MSRFIPYSRQNISQLDIDAVVSVLRSDMLTQGQVVPLFEEKISEHCGSTYAVATNSGTSALHLACLALELGENDIVWTSPITFVASANCALYCGAEVDFVDIDIDTNNMSANALEKKLQRARKTGKLPKIVIPVHLAGRPCPMKEIYALSKEYGFTIIEDASHALGARYLGEPVGGCRFSDITVFSFHPVKMVTTGEGGMALTNEYLLAHKIRSLRSHGVTRDTNEMLGSSDGGWYYEQIELGYNYRLTDIQAALGLSQLKRLSTFVKQRREIAERYEILLSDLPVVLPKNQTLFFSSYHLYIIRLEFTEHKEKRPEVFKSLRAAGIGVNVHYIPVYHHPFYRAQGFRKGYCPQAERYYAEALSIPNYPGLMAEQQEYVSDNIRKSLSL